jgi:hypothetical protein
MDLYDSVNKPGIEKQNYENNFSNIGDFGGCIIDY